MKTNITISTRNGDGKCGILSFQVDKDWLPLDERDIGHMRNFRPSEFNMIEIHCDGWSWIFIPPRPELWDWKQRLRFLFGLEEPIDDNDND